ncbi:MULTISPECIES: IclR family transcriptional regulator [Sphingobium]|uniref:IclR family transcriptional regulator n=1 Tax=Sphingobium TaxID=165695 RepID=UPI0022EEFA18|nr:helix-turn-helix domain-containing protein [Sphingobium sp. BS19]GLJ00268.1 transcriptional regulator [Sphingobium sp. BS19]
MTSKINTSSQHIFDILKMLSEASRPLGVKDVSQELGLPPSTTHRGLTTLLSVGYAARYQSSATYMIGDIAQRVRHAFYMRQKIRDLSLPYLQQLAFMTGETVTLNIRLGWYAVRIQTIPGTNEIISFPELGEVQFLDQSASARVILAHMPESDVRHFLRWRGKNETSSSGLRLIRNLREIAEKGYDTDARGYAEGPVALAFPVCYGGKGIASVTIEGAIFSGDNMKPGELRRFQDTVARIDSVAAKESVEDILPFDHLDPDTIALTVTE